MTNISEDRRYPRSHLAGAPSGHISPRARRQSGRVRHRVSPMLTFVGPGPWAARGGRRRNACRYASVVELEREMSRLAMADRAAAAYLVGTGPGDPGLLTLHAYSVLRGASVVLHDRLVSPEVLSLVPPSAALVNVGKNAGDHTVEGERLRRLLVDCALRGRTTVRLKGGDPSTFGRQGPELEALRAQGLPVVVVPGITSACAVAAELGFPLTDLASAHSICFLSFYDPSYVSQDTFSPETTYVLYMSLGQLSGAAHRLIAGGLDANIPAAAVERGTTVDQRTVVAPLHDLSRKVELLGLQSPCLVVVGSVVEMSDVWQVTLRTRPSSLGTWPGWASFMGAQNASLTRGPFGGTLLSPVDQDWRTQDAAIEGPIGGLRNRRDWERMLRE